MIALCWEVDPLQGIIKDVTRWLRNAGHPQTRRELLHHLCEMCGERMWVADHGTCTVATLRRPVRLRLVLRCCVNRGCLLDLLPYRP